MAILDADKEGFALRAQSDPDHWPRRAQFERPGHFVCRPHHGVHGKAIGETERRRAKQITHNEKLGITPRSIVKQVKDLIDGVYSEKAGKDAARMEQEAMQRAQVADMSEKEVAREIKRLEKQMLEHARNLEFEQAARLRDQLALLKERAFGAHGSDPMASA